MDEIILMLETLLANPDKGYCNAHFMCNSFKAKWMLEWESDQLIIQSEWWEVQGNLEKLLNNTSPLYLSRKGFLCEWKRVLEIIQNSFDQIKILFSHTSESKKLKEMSDQIPYYGLIYCSEQEGEMLWKWHDNALRQFIEKKPQEMLAKTSSIGISLEKASFTPSLGIQIEGKFGNQISKKEIIDFKPFFMDYILIFNWEITLYPLESNKFKISIPSGSYAFEKKMFQFIPKENLEAFQIQAQVILPKKKSSLYSNCVSIEGNNWKDKVFD